MSRGTDPALAAAFAADVVRPFALLMLGYTPDPVRITSLPFNFIFEDQTFYGVGQFGALSPTTEGTETTSYGMKFTLSGIPIDFVQDVIAADGQGRAGKLWVGLLDGEHRPIGAPHLAFNARIDTHDIDIGQTISVTVALESRLRGWNLRRVRRFTDQDQKWAYPGDRGLEFVPAVSEQEITWGRS